MNLGKHIYGSQQHIIIPETQHAIAVGFHLARPRFILRNELGVLSTIEFHHEIRLNTGEVRNVTGDRILAAKFEIL